MSDSLSGDSKNSGARPVNERSSAFVDSAAFLDFVRHKSLLATRDVKSTTEAVPSVSPASSAIDPVHIISYLAENTQADSQIGVDDWNSLFGAVEDRLRRTVEKPDSAATPSSATDDAARVKGVVLDCVSALEKLHQALRHERRAHAPKNGAVADNSVASPLTNEHDPRKK